ncbi:MAG: DUF3592 domain-containing protein [Ruminococcus sp.]|nr:DUF3592 domain-containing protein [Ruminococcus sp.]
MRRDKIVTKSDIVIAVMIGMIAAVFIGISIFIFVDTNIRYKRYERVTAKIVNVEYRRHRRTHYYKADYEYVLDGKKYVFDDGRHYSFRPIEGNKVLGYYDPDKPQMFYPSKRYDGLVTSSLLSIILIVCTIGSVIEMRTKDDEEKAKALHGIIRGINYSVFAVLVANFLSWRMSSFMILIVGVVSAFIMIFDSIRKLRQLKDKYGYY